MGDNLSLSATVRENVGKGAAREARKNNLVPGIIYGGTEEPVNINVKFNELLKKLNAGKFMSTTADAPTLLFSTNPAICVLSRTKGLISPTTIQDEENKPLEEKMFKMKVWLK